MKASAKKIAFILIPHFLAEGEEIRLIIKKEGHLTESIPGSIPLRIASLDRVKSTHLLITAGDSDNGIPRSKPIPIKAGEGSRGNPMRKNPEVTTSGLSPVLSFVSDSGISPITYPEERANSTPLLLVSGTGGKTKLARISSIKGINGTPAGASAGEKALLPEAPFVNTEAPLPGASFSNTETLSPEAPFANTEVPAPEVETSSTPSAGPERLSFVTASGTRVKAFGSKAKDLSFVTPSDTELETAECSIRRIPLVIVSGTTQKSVVVDYSGELEHTSIKRGQYLKDITSLIEGVKIIPVDHEYIEELNRKVTGYLKNFSPTVENPYPGSYYIDLTGTRRLFGREIDTCGRIILGLKAMGFTARCGVGSTTLVARLASEVAGDCAVYEVFGPSENLFVSPLSITLLPDLPLPVQKELREDLNIRKIGELLWFSKNDLRYLFGKTGELLYEYSRGRARNTLNEKKTEEALKWECVINSEGNDNRVLRRRFFDMLVEVCPTLRREQRVPKRAELTVVYRDNYRYITGGKLSHPSFFEEELYRELVFYLNRALQRRTSVKKFILCLSRFTHPSLQLELFEDALKATELSRACDLIRERYGSGSIAYGV